MVLSATNAFKDYSRKFETSELLNPLYHFVSFRQKSIGAVDTEWQAARRPSQRETELWPSSFLLCLVPNQPAPSSQSSK